VYSAETDQTPGLPTTVIAEPPLSDSHAFIPFKQILVYLSKAEEAASPYEPPPSSIVTIGVDVHLLSLRSSMFPS
jgi:hypothetical protein